ncbi:sulfotransferase [Colwellia sp. 1_MG-2023]|uniref:tetratricopeptide repeat-containing sulfotransferase family protein n=1 Tax=Colwellia sp. 1_MG-2023 TaxID=3062649 RepID=UPI0026E20AF1|nr:tetratricopeptide repeat-containing sulfotransferase family protein [Colwellia sp. 1_MG-2023]MDO6445720.1 sulfotransferase [Colwellia sp. 1_MG-2023]
MNFNKQQTITPQQRDCLQRAEKAVSAGNIPLAESEYRKLIASHIQIPQVYSQLAVICAQSNRIDEAKKLWMFALQLSPNFPDALIALGDVCKFERNFKQAIVYYLQALSAKPKLAIGHLNLSFCYLQIGKLEESEQSCLNALAIIPNFSQAEDHLGQIYIVKNELGKAQALFEKQLKVNGKNVKALYTLGNIVKSQGKLEKAKAYYQQAITIYPEYSQAHFTFATINKYIDKNDPHIALMQEEYNKANLPTENKIQLSFALSKAYEDLQDYSQAFNYLKTGNDLRHARNNYTIESDKVFFQNIIDTFTKDSIDKITLSSQHSSKPIFIIGMPRSGTTLVEKVLASHSKVHGAGELEHFFKYSTEDFLTENNNFLFAPLEHYPKEKLERIGQEYLKQLESINSNSEYITDKLPFNMLMVGFIKLVFPNAKIIHCVRNARDNCMSIFKRNFTTDNYRFAYNLKTLGQFHLLYQKLMEHWHNNFPGSIYDIEYETLIKNPKDEIKKLIQVCDLDWEEACLNFHQTEAVIKTASAYQVRQPIYDTSVGLWQKYEDNIAELLNELAVNDK